MLTSSPSHSPNLSPRPSFHRPSSRTSLHGACRPSSYSPQQRPQFAPPPPPPSAAPRSNAASTPGPSTQFSRPVAIAPSQPVPSQARPHSVDAGTQYSPDGFPPTAPRSKTQTATTATPITSQQPPKRIKTEDTPQLSLPADIVKTKVRRREEPFAVAKTEGPEPAVEAGGSVPPSRQPNLTHNARVNTAGANVPVENNAAKRARPGSTSEKVMPQKYETCDVKELGVLMANMIMEIIAINDNIELEDGKLTRFHSRAPPGISVKDYLNRLIVHATLSQPILLSMIFYMDRLCTMYPIFNISSLTVHRFLITAATVASKGLSDSFWTNNTYARVGGVSTRELALLELEFLEKLDWKIIPPAETLVDYYKSLIQRCEGYRLEQDDEMQQ